RWRGGLERPGGGARRRFGRRRAVGHEHRRLSFVRARLPRTRGRAEPARAARRHRRMASRHMSRITASDRLKRLLALLPWVASQQGPTVEAVCERFALATADLLSDIALVSLVGIPPYSPGDLFD